MASFFKNIIKIQCAVCGKDLGSFIDTGTSTILPAIFPKGVYTNEAITTVNFKGVFVPCMCPECAASQEEKLNDNNEDGSQT